jgi:hypothetical protein
MHIEAQKTTVFVIRLTLGEALAVLTDPAPLQKELRALLPARTDRPARSKPGGATRQIAHPKADPAKKPCPDCGKWLLPSSLWAHRKKQHSAAPAAA